MSCVCILAPVVVAAWPAFSSAVVAASASLGYSVAQDARARRGAVRETQRQRKAVELQIPNSEVVTAEIGRDQRLTVGREGVTITFARDARGRASLCIDGSGQTEAELRALGTELAQRVVQKYVHQRLLAEIKARQYSVVEEEVDANQCIRLKVRHWES